MLHNNQFIAQICSEPLLLHLFLPVPDLFVVHDAQAMETNRSRSPDAILRGTPVAKRTTTVLRSPFIERMTTDESVLIRKERKEPLVAHSFTFRRTVFLPPFIRIVVLRSRSYGKLCYESGYGSLIAPVV